MKQKMKQTTPSFKKNVAIAAISGLLIVAILVFAYYRDSYRDIDYSTYQSMLENNEIDKAVISGDYLYLKSDGESFRVPKEVVDINRLFEKVPVQISGSSINPLEIFFMALASGLIIYLIVSGKRERDKNTKKEPQKEAARSEVHNFSFDIVPTVSDLTFKDVAGIEEVKEELTEIIEFLKNPKKFRDFGVKLPKGVLLIGPPGVGKTMIAKAVAGEAGVPFFYQSGSAFVQIYVGVGALRVRELFAKAKRMAPSIIFIDEIDAVGKSRGDLRNDEREATLNQLLTEMDGFENSGGVIVIAATNKIEMLDEALLRPGRFDRRIFVSLPNASERIEILKVHLKKVPNFVDLEKLSRMTVGFSGAALASLVNEAALNALKKGKKIVELTDFEEVKEKVLYGKHKILSYSEKEKEVLALYRAAKAVAAYWYEIEFDKIALLGDGFKEIDKEIVSEHEFLAKIKLYLAGYAAMDLFLREGFSNVAEDLKQAKILATEMVEVYGMGNRLIPAHEDVEIILNRELAEVKELLLAKEESIVKIKEILLQKESVSYQEVKELLNEVL